MDAKTSAVLFAGSAVAGAYAQSSGIVKGITKGIPVISSFSDVILGAGLIAVGVIANKGVATDVVIAVGVGYLGSAILGG